MSDFEERLTLALRERAEDEVRVGELLDGAQRLGHRYQRRRRAAGVGAGAMLVVAAVVGGIVAVPALRHRAGTPVVPLAGVSVAAPAASGGLTAWPALPRPPAAPDAAPLTTDPTSVGVNPLLLHFDLDPSALSGPFESADWSSVGGVEQLSVMGPQDSTSPVARVTTVRVSPAPAGLDPLTGTTREVLVNGARGTLAVTATGSKRAGQVRWEPLAGVWAQVSAFGDDATILRLARGVTFAHVLRCAVPFRLATAPVASTVNACTLRFAAGAASGRATINIPGGGYLTVGPEPADAVGAGTTVIKGHPARVREYAGDGGALILEIDMRFGDHAVNLLADGHYDKAVVTGVAGGYEESSGTDPASWPASPLA